jgi:glycosyltransferase involved in cell wall biosynthesis
VKIAVVTTYYSEGMGYTENCLAKALAELGNDVHVLTSNLNVYGNQEEYDETYGTFLGPANQGTRRFRCDGYTVHRLPSGRMGQYRYLRGLGSRIRELNPDVVHCTEVASLQTFQLAAMRLVARFPLFTENHQHLSVIRPYMRDPGGPFLKRVFFRLTRTAPTWIASAAIERCYAMSPDCVLVATRYYGVPKRKLRLRPLGTDTTLFGPPTTSEDVARRAKLRREWGCGPDDIVCIYTGRLSDTKNPLLLARAVETLADHRPPYRSLFVGEGSQKTAIAACGNARVLPFTRHKALAALYQAADIAVWPRQESMSMLDATAAGLPIVVADTIGEPARVIGNGLMYRENNVADLARALVSLADAAVRRSFGALGRSKMVQNYSWAAIARSVEEDFLDALGRPHSG